MALRSRPSQRLRQLRTTKPTLTEKTLPKIAMKIKQWYSKESTSSMLGILLFCTMFLGYQCVYYDRSECPSKYKPLDPVCVVEDLKAEVNSSFVGYGKFGTIYSKSCAWTITAREGYSIALGITMVTPSEFSPGCFVVYNGKHVENPGNEVVSVSSTNHSVRSLKTEWNEVTIVFLAEHDSQSKSFGIFYAAYITEGLLPTVYATFTEILSCSTSWIDNKRIDDEKIENKKEIYIFDFNKVESAEILLYYCVVPEGPLTNFWLTADSVEKIWNWDTRCNNSKCRIYTKDLNLSLGGDYTFSVRAGQSSANVTFHVILVKLPKLKIISYAASSYLRSSSYQFDCIIQGDPRTEAYWWFYPKQHAKDCIFFLKDEFKWNNSRHETLNQNKDLKNNEIKLQYSCSRFSYILPFSLTTNESGCLVCFARSRQWKISKFQIQLISVPGPLGEFLIIPSENEALEDEMFALTCMANSFDYIRLNWTFQKNLNDKDLTKYDLEENDPLITLKRNDTDFRITLVLRFERLTTEHEGYYTCDGAKYPMEINLDQRMKEQSTKQQRRLKVVSVPVFTGNSSSLQNDAVSVKVLDGTNATLNCSSRGKKPINYEWKRVRSDGSQDPLDGYEREFIVVTDLQAQEAEAYVCIVNNTAGNITRRFNMQFITNDTRTPPQEETDSKLYIALSSAGTIFLLAVIVGVIFSLRWRRKVREYKKRSTQFVFLPPRGSVPVEVNIPLDVVWEFPDQRLVLGGKIGHGAYGRVVKAQAFGICPNEDETTVAVKMLKANASASHKKALLAELKILIHLGRNLNVVNLLGCVTKHQNLRKLMIIVEYCEKGCLLKLLQEQRKNFVCQVHQDTGRLDKNLSTFPFQKSTKITLCNLDNQVSNTSRRTSSEMVADKKSTSAAVTDENATTSSVKANETCVMDVSDKTNESGIMDESTTAELRFESTTEYSLCTVDLIRFSYQCGRGMEFIASRKLVHRDLAARNVLLTKDNIIKICDFGLSRDEHYLYNNMIKSALPIRWMAPESLEQHQFTTKSDVWSFGILLWEMFTLGAVPYAGMPIDQDFYNKIISGLRLEPPQTTPKPVSKLMIECWQTEPEDRPLFTEIVDCISHMLEDEVKNYYLRLNAPYEAGNRRNSQSADDTESINNQPLPEWLSEAVDELSEQPDDGLSEPPEDEMTIM